MQRERRLEIIVGRLARGSAISQLKDLQEAYGSNAGASSPTKICIPAGRGRERIETIRPAA